MAFVEVLGICEGAKEDTESWSNFLRGLKQRGLEGIQLVISDKSPGLVEALSKFNRKPDGKDVSYIFIAMFSPSYRKVRLKR